MGWESHHSRSTHPRHLGQHSANLSPATPMCLLSSPDSDLFLSAQGAGFNRPYTLNNYRQYSCGFESTINIVEDLDPVGEKQNQPFQLSFNPSLKVDFQGSRITSDSGLLLVRELDERLGLSALIVENIMDGRRGKNTQLPLSDAAAVRGDARSDLA